MAPKDRLSSFNFDYIPGDDYDINLPGNEYFDYNASSSCETDQRDELAFKNLFSSVLFSPGNTSSSLSINEDESGKPLSTFELLHTYRNGLKQPSGEGSQNMVEQNLSTGDILRVAGERFIQYRTKRANDDSISPFIHPFGPSVSGLSNNDARDMELMHLLLAAADCTGSQRYDIASELITRCFLVASSSGTPVQRTAFYFAEGLTSKIGREFGNVDQEAEKQNTPKELVALGKHSRLLACHRKLPFVQLLQISAVQAVIESVKKGGKLHVIDLQIRSGIQWTALMQGLVGHGIESFKVTAVGTGDKTHMEETGKRLVSFAQSLSLPFCFEIVHLQDMNEFKVDCVPVEIDETVVIYAFVFLKSMLSRPECIENLMREIKKLEPDLMVVVEVEANHNSPSFVGRFVESLFFYAAFLDCLKDCMAEDSACRTVVESVYIGTAIRNIVAAEGLERVTRNVKISVWRAFLARYGMREIELSVSARYQASLVLEKFENERSWNIENNGKGLIVGWKGTPLNSLTIWKFS